jgi:hypothetical protein
MFSGVAGQKSYLARTFKLRLLNKLHPRVYLAQCSVFGSAVSVEAPIGQISTMFDGHGAFPIKQPVA